ncbi:hypothetical protein [Aquimarina sp. SS2-1]|uniref:hypothetical protein n=1 Tax=Aquimarina besae TaxID=3342247 RepID=UPI00366E314C
MKSFITLSICLLAIVSCTQNIRTDQEIEQAFLSLDKAKLCKELETMTENDMLYRRPLDSLYKIGQAPPKKQWDSLWNLQTQLDDQNTRRLIEITEKYGFPGPKRVGKPLPIWIIFQHSDEKYCDQLIPLLERELEAKRITVGEYQMIQWNLDGRDSILPFKVVVKN